MTVLSYQSIRAAGIFSPFCERKRHEPTGLTYGCGAASYDVRLAEGVTLLTNIVVLASTMERFVMPNDVCGIVHDKSSLARVGVLVQNTFIDPGWCGYLTLELSYHQLKTKEMSNYTPGSLSLMAETPIAQIVLHRLDLPTLQPYSGRYQNQEPGAQHSVLTMKQDEKGEDHG